nr:hypothetical protein CFP56_53535 [Quercus suber]
MYWVTSVSLDGASHWVVAEDGLKNIVAFNLATEKFQYWKPLMFSKNCKKVLMEECHMDRTYLIRYDTENKIHKTVEIRKLPESFQATTCIEESSFA